MSSLISKKNAQSYFRVKTTILGKMTTPNWQHHSKKEQKRHLKPQALRQAKKRAKILKKKLMA